MSQAIAAALSGLTTAITRLSGAANQIAQTTTSGQSDASLDEAVVQTKTAQTDFAANAAVIRTQEKTDRDVLDILA